MSLQVNDKVALHGAPFGLEGRVLRIGHYSKDAGITGVLVVWSSGVAWTHDPDELQRVDRYER